MRQVINQTVIMNTRKKTRRFWSDEDKQAAVNHAAKHGCTAAARVWSTSPTLVNRWRKLFGQPADAEPHGEVSADFPTGVNPAEARVSHGPIELEFMGVTIRVQAGGDLSFALSIVSALRPG